MAGRWRRAPRGAGASRGQDAAAPALLQQDCGRLDRMPLSWLTPNVEVVRTLIASGADVHVRDTRAARPHCTPPRNGHPTVTPAPTYPTSGSLGQELVAVGARPAATADNGGTALGAAAQSGDGELVRVLVDAGADLDKADALGWTPLK